MRKTLVAAIPLLGLLFLRAPILRSQSKPDFARDIQPIFEKNCYACHGPQVQANGLRLDQKAPDAAQSGEIYRRVAGIGGLARMPKGGHLADDQIALIKAWAGEGAAIRPKH